MTVVEGPVTGICQCGCGELIRSHHPDPYFRWQNCQQLWRMSQGQDDPQLWRSEQRMLAMLFQESVGWSHCMYDWEYTTGTLAMNDVSNDPQVGLRNLWQKYKDCMAYYRQEPSPLPETYVFKTLKP